MALTYQTSDPQYLYENYREKALSRGTGHTAGDSIPPDDILNRSFKLKEEQLRKEEAKLKEIELRVQRELSDKRQELLAREEALRNMEVRSHIGNHLGCVFLYLTFCDRFPIQARLAQSPHRNSPR